MNKKSNAKVIVFYVVIIALIIVAASVILGSGNVESLEYSEIVTIFKEDRVRYFNIDQNGTLTMEYKEAPEGKSEDSESVMDDDSVPIKTATFKLQSMAIFYEDLNDTVQQNMETGHLSGYNYEEPVNYWWVSYLPYLLIAGVFIAIWVYMMRQATGRGGKMNSFARAKPKVGADEKIKVTFNDVAGADEEKEELEEVVEFLRNPAHFTKLGAKIPHGVLLVGPPGTGKTLLAKAVAGEAGVPFYSISGSDFVEMYVGVGASRVRDLFETARKSPASIIFIDEIDAVGRHRGAGLGGGHDEREQTLNQLLVEMDGFGSHDGVIVIAATNRPDILDPALLRPGRFDRQITVNYPDLLGREAILHVHAKNKPFENDVDFKKVAQSTAGFTGADLANLLNEAALLAARKNKLLISMDDIEQSSIKIMVGPQKKSMKIKENEKRKTAYHEAGHAILGHILPTQDPVRQISIIPSGRALGYTLNPPVEDKYSEYRSELGEKITMLLGGRVAEKIVFGDISGGASNDIQRATEIARKMVTRLGMSDELGPIVFGTDQEEVFLGRDFSNSRNYSETVATKIDEEIHKIINHSYAQAEEILRANMEKMKFIAEYLVTHEIMDDRQFAAVMDDGATVEQLEEMAEEKRSKTMRENAERKAQQKKSDTIPENTQNTDAAAKPTASDDKPTVSDDKPSDEGGK